MNIFSVSLNRYKTLAVGALLSVSAIASCYAAEPVLLSDLQLDSNGDTKTETVELWGTKLAEKSSYYKELLLLVKDADGKIVTAYKPTLNAGYACYLQKAKLLPNGEQIVLSGFRGADSGMDFRVIDVAKPKTVQELFSSTESMLVSGDARLIPDFAAMLFLPNGESKLVDIKDTAPYIARGIYDEQGSLLKAKRNPELTLTSVSLPDLDGDGQAELMLTQMFKGLQWEENLGTACTVWRHSTAKKQTEQEQEQEQAADPLTDGTTSDGSALTHSPRTLGAWRYVGGEFYADADAHDRFRRQIRFSNGMLYASQAIYKQSSVTYPIFTIEAKPELQKKINLLLSDVYQKYLTFLGKKECELDYTLPFAGAQMVSMIFFGVAGTGDAEQFERHPLNIDLATGAELRLADILNTKHPDLLPVIITLTAEQGVDFSKGLPQSWYYNGKNFVFCQQKQGTKIWHEAVVAAEDLQSFLIKGNILKQ